ncbi:PQQ-dependent catabolism-associated beta-propeller protein [Lysobacter arvi]|uniref:PQQ-dependent catabolism-associated beta-propeller protein n=1 Tax=Lysobacter arvi TaxID=3038776 RepID=A0ABU1CDB2_9GAMM|nr:PQQ-dependent catabolism-associated beta-propeller protein [Lysobacter arvi]MDR0182150.1 PQQ-dependent catabolism-associated beta-propeller protein [Lysobacter arvi]
MPVIARHACAVIGGLVAIAIPRAAMAHGEPMKPLAWTFDPWIVVPLLLALAWFLVGHVRMSMRSSNPRAHRASLAWFVAGWLVLAGALVTPLHAAGERSFAAHMLEHELLMLVAAPMLVMARPVATALWALPHRWRLGWANAGRHGAIAGPWRVLTAPIVATLLQAAVLWLWHAPAAFDLALANPAWHIVQHACFLVSALLFWWAMLMARPLRLGVSVGCLFFTATVSGALGALMAFSRGPWYAGYSALGLDAFGMSPTEDQQLAGLLMWVPGGLVHAGAGIALLARGLVSDTARRSGVAGLFMVATLWAPRAHADTIYVSDEAQHVLHVLADDGRVLRTIDTGKRPRGLHASRDGRHLYVAASNDNRIDVIDLAGGKRTGELPSGPDPEQFALSRDGRWMYIANEDDAKVSFVDIAARRIVAEVPVGAEPEGMAASPDGRWVICTSETASVVHFIDAHTRQLVDNVLVGTRPREAVFSEDGRWLWVSSEMRATVSVFDMRDRRLVRTIDFDRDDNAPVGVQAVGIAISPRYDRAFVALGRGNHVAEIEPASGRILRYFPVGQRTWSVALSRDGKRLYAAAGLSGDVTIIDLVRNVPMKTVQLGGKPWGLEVTP